MLRWADPGDCCPPALLVRRDHYGFHRARADDEGALLGLPARLRSDSPAERITRQVGKFAVWLDRACRKTAVDTICHRRRVDSLSPRSYTHKRALRARRNQRFVCHFSATL